MLTPDLFRRYSSDFAAFCDDVMIPTAVGGSVRFGDVMHDVQRKFIADLAPSLHALATGQLPAKPKFWAEMSKSWGKDLITGLAILWLLMFARRPVRVQLGAADQDQAAETHRSIVGILICRGNEWMGDLVETPVNRIVCKTTNSDAEVLAADVQGSHGAVGVDLLCLNELHAVTKWTFIENLADNASKNRACVTIACTNAGFKTHPAWKWREIARTSSRWAFHQVCEPPPWVDPEEMEEARRRNTLTRFMRLWYGVWSGGAGDAIDDSDIEAAIDRTLAPMDGKSSGVGFVAGLDLGIKHDHSALCVVGKRRPSGHDAHYRLASLQTWAPGIGGKVDLAAVEQAIIDAHSKFGLQAVAYDPWQAEFMAQKLAKAGLRMIEVPFSSAANLDSMARTLIEVFRNHVFSMYDCPRLVADLRKISIVERIGKGYRLQSVADADGHADAGTALVLALLAARDHCQATKFSWGGPVTIPRNDPIGNAYEPHGSERLNLLRQFFGIN